MKCLIFVGEDVYSINQAVCLERNTQNQDWLAFNFHRFPASQLVEAIAQARESPFGDERRVVVVDGFSPTKLPERHQAILQDLDCIPDSTTLIFTGASFDQRLTVSKALLAKAQLQKFDLIPEWRTDLIAKVIAEQSKGLKLKLDKACLAYLAEAIGNDTERIAAELQKLAAFVDQEPLTLESVQLLVPSTRQNSLQLADALRRGDTLNLVVLLDQLLNRGDKLIVICATLLKQVQTWLLVKAALQEGCDDKEAAKFANLGNPKRLFYLRTDVQTLTIETLIDVQSRLFQLSQELKMGAGEVEFRSTLIGLTNQFKQSPLKG